MKKVTDLKENECIHCATKEEFKAILDLNPKNTCELSYWETWRGQTIYFPYHLSQTGTWDKLSYARRNNYTIHPASDFLQPTYQLTKSQIIEISEDGSLVKELFPDVFEVELEVGKWYNWINKELLFCVTEIKRNRIYYYGFDDGVYNKIEWIHKDNDFEPATPEEVETALVNEAKRRGFVKGNVIKECLHGGDFNAKLVKGYLFEYESNQLWINSKTNGYNVCIFDNGTWAEIIQPPNDVIKVIETYGKDKLITLIESYDHNTDIYRAFSK